MNTRKKSIWCLTLTCLMALSFGSALYAQDTDDEKLSDAAPREMTDDEREINSVLQEIFWRVKANDNSAFYEQEFSYLRKKMTLDEYLTGISFKRPRKPNSDSVAVLTLDSVEVRGDTAMAYLTLTVDAGKGDPPRYMQTTQRLYRENGRWIKPLLTNVFENDAFYRRIEQYEKDAERESGG